MSDEYVPMKIEIAEDCLIQAKVRIDRIKAIADSLVTLDRNGRTDELHDATIGDLMNMVETQAIEAKDFLA